MSDSSSGGRVPDLHVDHETVELRLRQRERTLHLDRVLCRDHDERLRQGRGHAVDGRLPLLHGLQEGGLSPGRRPVDLVSQHDLREYGARPELEVAPFLVEEVHAEHVGRHEIGRELDALEAAAEGLGQHLGQRGLPNARNVLYEDVAAA